MLFDDTKQPKRRLFTCSNISEVSGCDPLRTLETDHLKSVVVVSISVIAVTAVVMIPVTPLPTIVPIDTTFHVALAVTVLTVSINDAFPHDPIFGRAVGTRAE